MCLPAPCRVIVQAITLQTNTCGVPNPDETFHNRLKDTFDLIKQGYRGENHWKRNSQHLLIINPSHFDRMKMM